MKVATEQRNAALEELNELAEAVDNADMDNDRIAFLVEAIEEEAYDDAMWQAEEYVLDGAIDDIADQLTLSRDDAMFLLDALRGSPYRGQTTIADAQIDRIVAVLLALKE